MSGGTSTTGQGTGKTSAARRRRVRALIRALSGWAVIAGLSSWAFDVGGARWPEALAWLEAEGLRVEDPRFLWALVALPVALLAALHGRQDRPRGTRLTTAALRVVVVLAVTAALVGAERRQDVPAEAEVVYLVDVSDSMPDEGLERAFEHLVAARRGLASDNAVRVVTFAEASTAVSPFVVAEALEKARGPIAPSLAPSGGTPPPPWRELFARPGGEAGRATDLEGALRVALGLVTGSSGEAADTRVVVATDGLATHGQAERVADAVVRTGAELHWLDLTALERPDELVVTAVDAPTDVTPGVPFEVRARVEATAAGRATCTVTMWRGPLADGTADGTGEGTSEGAVADAADGAGDTRPEGDLDGEPVTVEIALRSVAELRAADGATGGGGDEGADGANGEALRDEALAAATAPFVAEAVAELRVPKGKHARQADRRVDVVCRPAEGEGAVGDSVASNNRVAVALTVAQEPRVLYVEGERALRRNLLAALDKDFEVELRGPEGVPRTLADANAYDLIVVSDVPVDGPYGRPQLPRKAQRVLEDYARGGGGLIFAGGSQSFGPGGWGGTPLERRVLPVEVDTQRRDEIPNLALVLVIDRSGSMSGPKIELAKEAARATLEALDPSDKLGVIAFDSAPSEIVRLQRASNRLRITDNLRRLSPGGGTNIFPALDTAYQALAATEAKVKHIILLTDGQSNRSGILELVAQGQRDRVTLSTVAVGMGSDVTLLMQAAEEGGGRPYYTDRPDNLPKLFLDEANQMKRQAVVEDRFEPRVVRRFARAQIFRGLDMRRAPPLLGYVATRAKKRAEVLMVTHLGEPLLARWTLGLGKVVVWTSDVKNRWSHHWLKWGGYAQFWRQVGRDTQRVEREAPSFAASLRRDGDEALIVTVDAVDEEDRFMSGLAHTVDVVTPSGRVVQDVGLERVAAGRYEGRVALEPGAYGPYRARGRHWEPADIGEGDGGEAGGPPEGRGATVWETEATAVWPYAAEDGLRAPDVRALEALAEASGGVRDPSPARVAAARGVTTTWAPVGPWALLVALAALVVELIARRLSLGRARAVAWREVLRG